MHIWRFWFGRLCSLLVCFACGRVWCLHFLPSCMPCGIYLTGLAWPKIWSKIRTAGTYRRHMQTTGKYRRIITYIRDTNTAVNQNPAVLSTDNVAEEFHTRNETSPAYRPITPVISRGPPFPLFFNSSAERWWIIRPRHVTQDMEALAVHSNLNLPTHTVSASFLARTESSTSGVTIWVPEDGYSPTRKRQHPSEQEDQDSIVVNKMAKPSLWDVCHTAYTKLRNASTNSPACKTH